MSRGKKVTFSWRPKVPTRSLSFAIHAEGDVLPDHYFAYVLHAVDADGDTVLPSDSKWAFSKSLSGYFQYSKSMQGSSNLSTVTWEATTYIHEVTISVVQWSPEEKETEVKAAAIATRGQYTDNRPVRWEVVSPVSHLK